MGNYDEYVKEASETYGVSEDLINAIIKTESGGDPNAVSNAGAKGLMQLMSPTFQSVAGSDADPFDPRTNIMAGTKYFSQLLKDSNDDVELALAKYNAGAGNVAKYGKEKYSSYYTKVLSNVSDDYHGGTKENLETNWWGDIVVVVFIILVLVIGVILLGLSVSGYSPKKAVEKVRKPSKKGGKNGKRKNGK